MQFLDQIPWTLAILAALTLGLAPFFPEPHIWEKLKMLVAGRLSRPVDIFDLLLHAAPWALLVAKAVRAVVLKS
ncbi:RND transporter [Octadecabacter sp. SW4]|uniref:RND transporter n=1 Tax=Octadecabacter sp. SW4 TaxID=2602067 RepID=UPI0011C1D7D8|nr:RND transporter [Octadecabacter sp. SW4]QEE35796.1 RND transporter [Octadecabacter sp. SW4]|tara:strand:+ start:120 stop:341 length:222 start_codon:yes stop_codon:yes gene_type:complete